PCALSLSRAKGTLPRCSTRSSSRRRPLPSLPPRTPAPAARRRNGSAPWRGSRAQPRTPSPRTLVAGLSHGVGTVPTFLPGVLVHLIGFGHVVGDAPGGKSARGRALERDGEMATDFSD